MRKIEKVLISWLILSLIIITVNAAGAVPEKVIKATESVVRILAKYSDGYATGTGFVIKSDKNETLIVTNHHVVADNPYIISVWVGENDLINAEILATTSQKDICILRLTQQISLKPVTLSQASAKQGDAVYAVGFPAAADMLSDTEAHTSQDATITDGIVSARREVTTTQYGTPVEILQISAAINSGNSGGPLFDLNGKVVGVNTYGIADAQGIFGAIDISEIHRFLDENGVSVKSDFKVIVLIALLTGIALVAIGCIIAFRRKQKVSKGKNKKRNVTTLRNFMAAYPNGLGIHDAVALLLPVALQLRDMHNNGQPHLQVSPDTIMVGTTAKLAAPTEAETDRYTSGFAAKEIYSGSGKGILSDIYSFCAVLYYASFGSVPVNALQRSTEDICTKENNTFAQIINKGMQMQPEDRFDTMQSVILRISEFNVKPFTLTEKVTQHKQDSHKKKRKSKKSVVIIIISVIMVLLVCGYLGCFFAVQYFAKSDNFSATKMLLQIPAMSKLYEEKLSTYVDAGILMENRQYTKAKELLETIPGYLNADDLMLEADYCHAAQLADANDFINAIRKYNLLASQNYKDSKAKALETRYRQGLYIMYEQQNYLAAYTNLKNSDYNEMSNISEVRNELRELLYQEAVMYYRKDELDIAKSRFVDNYKDSDKYLLLIKGKQPFWWYFNDNNKKDAEKLIDLFYFEDTPKVLLFNHEVATVFLEGTWRSSTGGKYFTMNKDGYISYNLPWFNYGDYYKISDGDLLLYPKNDESATRSLFSFSAITPNQIEVYCHKDGSTYILTRQ